MRTRLMARRRGAPAIPDCNLRDFEFAHLLDAVSLVVPDVVPDVGSEVTAEVAAEVAVEIAADMDSEAVADVVDDLVVSRFADSGLDDDRLPLAVKRRRGRRR